MLNHIVLMGRLTRDPELRRTGSGIAVASFTLAVDRDFASQGGEKETDFVDIVAWRSTAEFVSKYFTKVRTVTLENVRFGYHDKEILHGVTMELKAGTVNAIVGPSA